jgi:hypothetical protein
LEISANKISFLLIFLFLNLNLSGQKQKPKNESWYDEKPLHFGFSLGLNTMDFKITPSRTNSIADTLYPEVSILTPGINIQIVTNLRTGKYFDVRFLPGVSFGQRNIRYYKIDPNISQANLNNQTPVLQNDKQRIESSFLEFPLLLKFKGDRLNNVRPYIIGGFNFRYDLAGQKEFDDQNPVYLRLKRPDLYYEAGAGFDFYLSYFKLSIELKMSDGIGNVLVNDPAPGHQQYYNAIEKMTSQIWVLSFHFE